MAINKAEYIITPAILKRMIVAGGKLLEINKQTVDALNVFPVPDGDTGTNMSLTMKSAVKEIYSVPNNDMEELAKKLSSGALRGARGNSGVILSQIFKGFSAVILQSKKDIDAKLFAKALQNGAKVAYDAVAKPKEGTILTVVRVMAEQAVEIAKKSMPMADFISKLIAVGEDILAKTPDMLDALKKAGVVDSGGYGLLVIFKGFLMGYNDVEVTGAEDYNPASAANITPSSDMDAYIDYESLEDIEFAYCTEFFVINLFKKTMLSDIDKLREKLMAIGDSVVTVGDLTMIKVHVHTNTPGIALQYGLELGELDKLKIENMKEQNRQLKAKFDAERKHVGMLAICAGEGFRAIFKDLLVDQVIEGGQTMNPSADDIAQAIRKINADNVIVMPNNKNIILAAEQARGLVQSKQVFVVPTKNVPQGLAATLSFNPEAGIQENLNMMNNAIPTVKTGSVTYAVRSSAMDGLTVAEGDIIGLDGNKIVNKGHDVADVTKSLIDTVATPDSEVLTLYYGEDVSEDDAEKFADELREEHPDWEVDVHFGGQPLYYYIFSVE